MSAKRANPKKNKAARRRRPVRPAGLRRARITLGTVGRLMASVSDEVLPLAALAAVWLWNLAEDGEEAAHCVDGCLTLHCALAEYQISSGVEAVELELHGNGWDTFYGSQQGPRYNPDGSFNGHAILLVPGAGRLIDPTLQQYPEIPDTEKAALPVVAPLPAPGGLGSQPYLVDRGDHQVVYLPVAEHQRQAWRSPLITANMAGYRQAGANLAATVVSMMRRPGLRDRAARFPYPRLRTLLAAVDGAELVADSRGCRFRDPVTGGEFRLADVP
jgi:hypothetical protein